MVRRKDEAVRREQPKSGKGGRGAHTNSPFLLDSHLRCCLHVANARLQSGALSSLCTATVSLAEPYIAESSGDWPSTSLKPRGRAVNQSG